MPEKDELPSRLHDLQRQLEKLTEDMRSRKVSVKEARARQKEYNKQIKELKEKQIKELREKLKQ